MASAVRNTLPRCLSTATSATNRRAALQRAAAVAAEALGLEVWGGDALFDGDDFAIVDFNDWPSFGRVREEAARAIARRSLQLLGRQAASREILGK